MSGELSYVVQAPFDLSAKPVVWEDCAGFASLDAACAEVTRLGAVHPLLPLRIIRRVDDVVPVEVHSSSDLAALKQIEALEQIAQSLEQIAQSLEMVRDRAFGMQCSIAERRPLCEALDEIRACVLALAQQRTGAK